MFPYYRAQVNRHGLQKLVVPVDDPLARLGIGQDEARQHLDMKIEYIAKRQNVVIPDLNTAPLTLATFDGIHEAYEEDEFEKSFYMGDTLGGI
jgi:hypothetical protein